MSTQAMQSNPLRSPKAKIQRAKKHIDDVRSQISSFLDAGPPAELYKELEPDGLHELIKLRMTRGIPDELAATVGDALTNLRSALDQLTRALATKNDAASVSDVYFPFARSAADFEQPGTRKKIRKLSCDAQSAIRDLKPYQGGNDFLWSLSRLAGFDKHQELIAIGGLAPAGTGTFTMKALDTNPHVFAMPAAVNLQGEIELLRYRAGGDMQGEMNMSIDVGFGDVEVVKHQPVRPTLAAYLAVVHMIVDNFEKRFFA